MLIFCIRRVLSRALINFKININRKLSRTYSSSDRPESDIHSQILARTKGIKCKHTLRTSRPKNVEYFLARHYLRYYSDRCNKAQCE